MAQLRSTDIVLAVYIDDDADYYGTSNGAYNWATITLRVLGDGTFSVILTNTGSGSYGSMPSFYIPYLPSLSGNIAQGDYADGEEIGFTCIGTTKTTIDYNEQLIGGVTLSNWINTTVDTNNIECGFNPGEITSIVDDISISSNCAITPEVSYSCGYNNHRLTIEIDTGAGYTNLVNIDEANSGTYQKQTTYTGLSAGTSYNIRARLYDSAGGTLLDESIVSLSTDNVTTSVTLDSITANSIAATGAGSAYAGWTYEVERQQNGGGWTVVATYNEIGGTNLSKTDSFIGGEYRVKLTTGCGDSATSNILQLCNLSITNVIATNETAVGANDGSINIVATGAVVSVEYSINGTTWQASQVFYGVAPGTYTAYVREAWRVGCNASQADVMVDAANPSCDLAVTEINTTDESTSGAADGTITITATATDTIEYSNNGGSTWQLGNTFTGLAAGAYNVQVREQASPGTCLYTQVVVIYEGDVYTCNIGISVSIVNETVSGENDGQITVTTTGGTAPFEYRIGGSGAWQSSNVFSGLADGTYIIEAREVNTITCEVNTLATVQEGTSCPVSIFPSSFPVYDRSQFGGATTLGSLYLTFAGSSGGSLDNTIEFRLLNGNRTIHTDWANWVWTGSAQFTNLSAGTYYIQWRLLNGDCFEEIQRSVITIYLSEIELSESCPSPYYITNSLTVTGNGSDTDPAVSLAQAQADAENKLITQLVCILDRGMFTDADSRDIDTGRFTLSYYPKHKSWLSFHSYYPSFYITTRKKLYNFNEGIAYNFASSYKFGLYYDETIRLMFVEFVANPNEQLSKLFSGVNWITVVTKANSSDVLDTTFDTIRALSSANKIPETTLVKYSDINNLGNLRNIKNTWFFSDLQNASESIGDRKRIIDKFMRVQLKYNNSKDLENSQYLLSLHSFNVDFKVVK